MALLGVMLLVLVACASEPASDVVTGVVSQVTGGSEVESFVVVDADGASHAFTPAEGLTCDGESLEHLRDHLVDRDRISVRYEVSGDGARTAVSITHLED